MYILKRLLIYGCLIALILYGGYWAFIANTLTKQIDAYVKKSEKEGTIFYGPKPVVTGFPGKPGILYTKGLKQNGQAITFSEFHIKSFFLPGTQIHIGLPDGMSVKAQLQKQEISIDSFALDVRLPLIMPLEITEQALTEWQKGEHDFIIENMTIKKETLDVSGTGTAELDTNLQPVLNLETRTTGHKDFLASLERSGVIPKKQARQASFVLSGLTKSDETGENYLEVSVTLRNQTLSLGPLPVARFPLIRWDTRNPPDPRQ